MSSLLPSLFLDLSVNDGDSVELAHRQWLRACGVAGTRTPPPFKEWHWLRAKDKRRFYQNVQVSENDRFSLGQYMMPYSPDKDIDALLRDAAWSIEHVLPRSKSNGSAPGEAEDDFFAWEPAYRAKNSSRGNLPLVLWPMPEDTGVGRVDVETDGVVETHYNPVESHKARLARRWLYVRATYAPIDTLDPPSRAQYEHKQDILNLVKTTRLEFAERRLGGLLSKLTWNIYNQVWRNPLYDPELADSFLSDPGWNELVFPANAPVAQTETSPTSSAPQTAECASTSQHTHTHPHRRTLHAPLAHCARK